MNESQGNISFYIIPFYENCKVKYEPYNVNKATIFIGRHRNADITITSNDVSEFHAALTRINDNVFIRDYGSRNGVYVNGYKIIPNKNYQLSPGDIFSLVSPNANLFNFVKEPSVVIIDDSQSEENKIEIISLNEINKLNDKISSLEKDLATEKEVVKNLKLKVNEDLEGLRKEKDVIITDLTERNEKLQKDLQSKQKALISELSRSNQLLIDKANTAELRKQLNENLKRLSAMEKSNEKLEATTKEKVSKIKDMEDEAEEMRINISKASMDIVKLDLENRKLTTKLDAEMCGKTKQEVEFKTLKNKFVDLEKQLFNVTLENDKISIDIKRQAATQQEALKKAQDYALKDMQKHICNVMEIELNCSICSEFFIEATTLGCSHTFCHHCITLWKKQNKQDCPMCRKGIQIECKSPAIDKFIEKIMDYLAMDVKKQRNQLIVVRNDFKRFNPSVVRGSRYQNLAPRSLPPQNQRATQGGRLARFQTQAASNVFGHEYDNTYDVY